MQESNDVKTTENILLAASMLALDVPYVRCQVRRTPHQTKQGYPWCEFMLSGVQKKTWESLHSGQPCPVNPVWVAFCYQKLRQALNRIQHEGLDAIELNSRFLHEEYERSRK